MQLRRGMMKIWNVWMIFATLMLSILGTLLTLLEDGRDQVLLDARGTAGRTSRANLARSQ